MRGDLLLNYIQVKKNLTLCKNCAKLYIALKTKPHHGERMLKKKKLHRTIGTNSQFNRPPTAEEAEFAKLQKHWYTKLKAEGFKDLEWVDSKTGFGHDAPFRGSKSLSYLRSKYSPGTEEHYRRCRVFLAHYKFTRKERQLKYIMNWHTEGLSLRDMLVEMEHQSQSWDNPPFKKVYSVYWVHCRLQEILDFVDFWHYLDEHGLDNPANDEFVINDIPLKPTEDYHE